MISTRKLFNLSLLIAPLLAAPLAAQTDESPEKVLGKVDARLLAWDTAGARELLDGRRITYALVRPPGHHAERARGMGFCLFANAAIGALQTPAARDNGRTPVTL
mgnify:CR=1 FL=1